MTDHPASKLQTETLELSFDECQLSEQAVQDLEEALRGALRLRRLTLLDVLPSMLSVTTGMSGLEELSLLNICSTETDLGPFLQVNSLSWRAFSVLAPLGCCHLIHMCSICAVQQHSEGCF